MDAGARYGIDPWILAGIGAVETDHGRSSAPGVRSGVNSFGCCAGPMQFSIRGKPSTWDRYGRDGNHNGHTPSEPADAIPAAARYLRASGAPADYHAALFA
jgi:membrane-bound lytic murein transglycosylase B